LEFGLRDPANNVKQGNEGGKGEQFPGRRITMGALNHSGGPTGPNNMAST